MRLGLYILFVSAIIPVSLGAQLNLKQAGKQSFQYAGVDAVREKPIRVWYYSPTDRPDTLPIVVMLHGAERNAAGYLDQWIPVAEMHQYVVVAPEFSKENYGGASRYNQGNVFNLKGSTLLPSSLWTFSVIEPLFDFICENTNNSSSGYFLSGHSAGAQFVHRFLYLVPNNRASKVAIANAGWYTFPSREKDYPFGLNKVPTTEVHLKKIYEKELFVVLGEADTATSSPNYNKGPEYDWQGAGRFDRGMNYFNTSLKEALLLKSTFRWKLITLPGVAHSNASTAKAIGALFKMNIKNN